MLGAMTHLYSGFTLTAMSDAFEEFDQGTLFGLTLYSYLSGFACMAGAVGVLKNNVKKLQFFNCYYWVDLALHTAFSVASAVLLFTLHTEICSEVIQDNSLEMDMTTCEAIYVRSAWVITSAMLINMLLKLHFAFAIHAYTNRVRADQEYQQGEQTIVIEYTPVPAMDEKQNVMFVAGKEFIPDHKK
ncbi:hypothetical protein DM01DRAFT_323375 [Hesseltinella vesiculosa]|uniref:Uncharacterized protein n=1 Tax=Hesseltinella vesiculosa TaxID=101127 RepID=A0A1X2GLZ8_9FUNG|nr:hypothetical protein DM01DRAFT_323375 [Hesseltinella vesiculosa]